MNQKNKKYPKRTRLKEFSYSGSFAYFVIICTYQKNIYFTNEKIVKIVLSILQLVASRFKFTIYAYCFMPDHLHLLSVGTDENSSLKDFIKAFKQKSGFYFKQRYNASLWQVSYYDHVLRREESLNDVARYIFENLVRKNLVEDFRKYPFLGSSIYPIDEFRQT